MTTSPSELLDLTGELGEAAELRHENYDPVKLADPNQVMNATSYYTVGAYPREDGRTVLVQNLNDFDMDTGLQTLVIYDPTSGRFIQQTMQLASYTSGVWGTVSGRSHGVSFEAGQSFLKALLSSSIPETEISPDDMSATVDVCTQRLRAIIEKEQSRIAAAQKRVGRWTSSLAGLVPVKPQ